MNTFNPFLNAIHADEVARLLASMLGEDRQRVEIEREQKELDNIANIEPQSDSIITL